MRLLMINECGELTLTEDLIDKIPPYAILSHTWGADKDEVTFDDVQRGIGKSKAGYDKLQFCGEQARRDKLDHFWVDTCSINKANHTEYSEAVTSMFRWYQQAARCYVFLSDVSINCVDREQAWCLVEVAIRKSRWFRRGWTLQELLAPASVEFFSREGRYLGNKQTLEEVINEVTGVPVSALRGKSLSHFPDEEKLRWVNGRETKRTEDLAYCLLGIFNVFIPLMYGEKENAMHRLKEEIRKRSPYELPHDRKIRKGVSRVLRLLKTSDYEGAKFNSARRVHGTCEWFVQSPDYKRWRQETRTSLLLYSADPGCGKTVLAGYLVDEVYKISPLTLYFFFQKRGQQQNALSTTLCAILHQLYSHRPDLLQYAEKAYQEFGRQLMKESVTLWRLFKESVANSCEDEIICVFDALDECDTEQSKLLFKLLLEEPLPLCSGTKSVKFIITSRPYYLLQQLFREIDPHLPLFRITGETESRSISRDVEIFIHSQVSRLNLEKKERFDVERKLLQKQNHDQTFLWAFLITQQLCTNPPSTLNKLLASIDQLPSTVVEAYESILQDCADIRKTRKILSIVVAARQPLSLDQMDTILALETQVKSLQDLDLQGSERLAQTIRHTCGLFIRIFDSKVFLIHQTAQDFLLSDKFTVLSNDSNHPEIMWQRSIMKTQSHFELASACIKLLSLEGMAYRFPSWFSCTQRLLGMPTASNTSFGLSNVVAYNKLREINEFAAYAKANWTFHLVETLRYLQAHQQVLSIERFLGFGLDLQMLDSDGKSVLHRLVDSYVAQIDMELVKCVLEQGGLVDGTDHDNMTCMHYAVLRCHQELARILRGAGFDINRRVQRKLKSSSFAVSGSNVFKSATQSHLDQYGLTPLHAAAFFGREDIIPYLIDQGADINAQDEYGQTPIHLVLGRHLKGPQIQDIWEDDIHMVEFIPDWEDEYSARILSDALDGRTSIVSTFCENPVFDPNTRNRKSQTPLHSIRYSEEGKTRKMVELLVDRGASRTATDDKGKTPIHVAARAGDFESLAILVKDQEDLNLRDKKGRNALHLAAQNGSEDVVLFILTMASSLNLHETVDVYGRNALHHALHSGSKWLIFPRQEVLNILLQGGVSARHTDQVGMDPLAYYMANLFFDCGSEVVSLLLAHGANIHFQDELGKNLAHHLMGSQMQVAPKTLKALEDWGVDIQARDQKGQTILHHAAIHGSVSIALLYHLRYCHLLDFDTQDDSGMTAMRYADEESKRLHSQLMFRPDRWKETIAAFNAVDSTRLETTKFTAEICPCNSFSLMTLNRDGATSNADGHCDENPAPWQ